jgi:hypothetical protein
MVWSRTEVSMGSDEGLSDMTKLRYKPIAENIKMESARMQVMKLVEGIESLMVESTNNISRSLYEVQLQALDSVIIMVDIIGETDISK